MAGYEYAPDFVAEALALYGDNEQVRNLLEANSIQVGHHFTPSPEDDIQPCEIVAALNPYTLQASSELAIRAIDAARRQALREAWKTQVIIWVPHLANTTFFEPIVSDQQAA